MNINRKHLVIAVAFGAALGVALLLVPRLLAIASFGFGYGPLKELFAERLGMSETASEFIAGALVFFLPLATYILFINIFSVWSGRASLARVAKVFAAYALVYLLPTGLATVRDSLAAPQCFLPNGQPRLYYSIQPGGAIELLDRPGFDRFGSERKQVTSEVCRIADRQRSGLRPGLIPKDTRKIEFFDAAGGGARVFYSRSRDGRVELFDGPGVNPTTNEVLQPVTPAVVEELRRASSLIEQQQMEEARRRKETEDAEGRKRVETASVERARREFQETERKGREEALGLLSRLGGNSSTGYECAFHASGVIMRRPRNVPEQAEWSDVTARASYASFDRNADGIPRQTALTIEIRSADSTVERPKVCVLVVASPAPLDPSPIQNEQLRLGLDALARLGVNVVGREPAAAVRRKVLLPTGMPSNSYSYGCVRNGMPSWCSGENRCAVETIPVVSTQCSFMEGVTRCRVQCQL